MIREWARQHIPLYTKIDPEPIVAPVYHCKCGKVTSKEVVRHRIGSEFRDGKEYSTYCDGKQKEL